MDGKIVGKSWKEVEGDSGGRSNSVDQQFARHVA